MIRYLLLFFIPFATLGQDISTTVERSGFRETPAYGEVIQWWASLDRRSGQVKMHTMGPTDSGFPLHLVIISGNGNTDLASLKKRKGLLILVNNGIHPGEPDGIDASMMLARDIVTKKKRLPNNVILAIIPLYNIGGALNRSRFYRVDQNGPDEFGFRGNGQNLDLNRDFIKNDSRNAASFSEIFHLCDPDILIDNHVSNGADYQHIMTLLSTQHNKLGGEMGTYLHQEMEPAIYRSMKEKGFDLVPYVNNFSGTPENGWPEFFDSPRYASGYATLFQTFGFTPETHMLKPYEQRVRSTYALMESFIDFSGMNYSRIIELRKKAKEDVKHQKEFPLAWKNNREKFTEIEYRGFEAGKKESKVSGLPRLYYDRNLPFTRKVRFYNFYEPENIISRPEAYIIPQGWWKVVELLDRNKVKMQRLAKDTVLEVEYYMIEEYKSLPVPYEGHHLNTQVKVRTERGEIKFRKGDYYIPLDQEKNRFIVEVLEPTAGDSYFTWNFFDPILGQKEGYSHYVFEDFAAGYLEENPDLRSKLEEKKRTDTAFAGNGAAQLSFIYRNSPYYEPDHMRYPVFRRNSKLETRNSKLEMK